MLKIFSLLLLTTSLFAVELIPWSTPEGIKRFERSQYKKDFFPLANHFESQANRIYCGPTTAVIVLNALRVKDKKVLADEDQRILNSKERAYLPKKYNPLFKRYTQNNVFLVEGAKAKEIVLGKPQGKDQKKDFGFQLRQYNKLLKAHNLKTQMTIVDEKASADKMRASFLKNLNSTNDYIIVNYSRKALGQKGGGHISPVAAYDKKSDSFLIMDVNPNKAPWAWVKSIDLFNSMKTYDTIENRGFILVEDK